MSDTCRTAAGADRLGRCGADAADRHLSRLPAADPGTRLRRVRRCAAGSPIRSGEVTGDGAGGVVSPASCWPQAGMAAAIKHPAQARTLVRFLARAECHTEFTGAGDGDNGDIAGFKGVLPRVYTTVLAASTGRNDPWERSTVIEVALVQRNFPHVRFDGFDGTGAERQVGFFLLPVLMKQFHGFPCRHESLKPRLRTGRSLPDCRPGEPWPRPANSPA